MPIGDNTNESVQWFPGEDDAVTPRGQRVDIPKQQTVKQVVYERDPTNGNDAVATISTVSGGNRANEGYGTLIINDIPTASIAWNATAAQIQAAILATNPLFLENRVICEAGPLNSGDVTVTIIRLRVIIEVGLNKFTRNGAHWAWTVDQTENQQGETGDFFPQGTEWINNDDATVFKQFGENYLLNPDWDSLAVGEVDTPNLSDVLTEGNDASGNKIINLADPEDDQDAATKAYVDLNGGGTGGAYGVVSGFSLSFVGNTFLGIAVTDGVALVGGKEANWTTNVFSDNTVGDYPLADNATWIVWVDDDGVVSMDNYSGDLPEVNGLALYKLTGTQGQSAVETTDLRYRAESITYLTGLIGAIPTATVVSQVQVTNSTAEAVFVARPIEANEILVGTTYRISIAGVITTGASPGNTTFRIRVGTTTLIGNTIVGMAIPTTANMTAAWYTIDGLFQVTSIGASGDDWGSLKMTCGGQIGDATVNAFTKLSMVQVGGATIDTTTSNIIELTVQNGHTDTTIDADILLIEKIY